MALGLRPEAISIGNGALAAKVRVVEPTGHENIVILEAEGLGSLTARTPVQIRPTVGETVQCGIDTQALHLFDGENGHRRNRDEPVVLQQQAEIPMKERESQ